MLFYVLGDYNYPKFDDELTYATIFNSFFTIFLSDFAKYNIFFYFFQPLKPKSHEANLLAANALAACKLADSPCMTTYSPLAGSPR